MEKAIDEIITLQRKFFADGATRATAFRLDALTKLRKAVRERTDALSEALREDLNKSAGESYLTEIGLVMQELECHIRHLKRWSRSRRVSTPLTLWPSRSRIRPEPLGVALIVAPWNYPVQLLLCPLVGAISAGNCVLLKSSPLVPHVEAALRDLIAETFGPEYVAFVEGGGDVLDELLKRRFDSIFFTGGSKYGRVVMEAAAKNLTPVTLELGGKSPCIVGRSANIRLAARRIHVGQAAGCGPDLRRAGLSARSSGPEGRAVPGNEACGRGVFRRLPASKSGLSAYRFGAGDRPAGRNDRRFGTRAVGRRIRCAAAVCRSDADRRSRTTTARQ